MKPETDSRAEILVDGRRERVETGMTVAAVLFNLGHVALRRSVTGEPRGVVCGMGVCFECRVRINGLPHQRACLTTVVQGMDIITESHA